METAITFEKTKLVSEIQEVLNSWLSEKPEVRSVASLARATGVADSSIRRLLNNGIKIQEDSIFKLLAHIFEIQSFDGISAALEKKPEALKWFERHFSYLKKAPALQEYKFSNIESEITLNQIAFSVFALASTNLAEITDSYIKDQFGIRGEIEMEDLIQKGVLKLSNGKLTVLDGTKIKIDKEQAINLMPDLTRTYLKKDSIHNYRVLEVEAVSQKGFGDLMDLYAKFVNDTLEIVRSNPGTVPVIVSGFVDTFTTQPYFEGGKNETPN